MVENHQANSVHRSNVLLRDIFAFTVIMVTGVLSNKLHESDSEGKVFANTDIDVYKASKSAGREDKDIQKTINRNYDYIKSSSIVKNDTMGTKHLRKLEAA